MIETELIKLLDTLITQWENEVIEFKSGGSGYSTDDIGEYFSALSNEANLRNCEKAWLVFGVNNKTHAVTGTDYRSDPARLNSLKMQIKEGTDPSVSLSEIHVLNHLNGRVILFEIPAAPQGIPIAWKGHYYARDGESKVALGLDKLEKIRNQGIEQDWSAQYVPEATIDDLDPKALEKARKGFAAKYANRFSEAEIQSWSTETFLDRAQVTRSGKITRTTLLLLGKAESAHLLNPHPAQMTWKLVGEERAYEHFGPPFLLNTSKLFKKIRNIQIRIFPDDSLLAVEVAKYDRKVVLEGLHNCIAHQDYTRNARIIVTEYIDRLTLFNAGNFYEGEPIDYISGEKTPSRYRNKMLAKAMAELNMIDTMGYGIHDMFMQQTKRGFPLQDYEKTQDSVTVTIYGRIIDEAYSALLLNKTNLKPDEIICLDRIQKKLPVDSDNLKELRKAHLIEGRMPNIRIAKEVEQVVSNLREQTQSDDKYTFQVPFASSKNKGVVLSVGTQVRQGAKAEQRAKAEQGAKAERGAKAQQRAKAGHEPEIEDAPAFLSILNCLKDGSPINKKELAALLHVRPQTGSFYRTLKQLLKLDLIEQTETKKSSPNQAYRITEHGKNYLNKQEKN